MNKNLKKENYKEQKYKSKYNNYKKLKIYKFNNYL